MHVHSPRILSTKAVDHKTKMPHLMPGEVSQAVSPSLGSAGSVLPVPPLPEGTCWTGPRCVYGVCMSWIELCLTGVPMFVCLCVCYMFASVCLCSVCACVCACCVCVCLLCYGMLFGNYATCSALFPVFQMQWRSPLEEFFLFFHFFLLSFDSLCSPQCST